MSYITIKLSEHFDDRPSQLVREWDGISLSPKALAALRRLIDAAIELATWYAEAEQWEAPK